MTKFSIIHKLAVAGVLVVAALAANAVVQPVLAAASGCTNGTSYKDFNGTRTGRDTLTVWPKKKLCKDAKVNFTTFEVLNKNYNGKPFKNNPTALPQASIWNKTVTLKKGSTSKVTVKMGLPDDCTPYQIDAYVGPVQTKITTSAGLKGTRAIVAKLFDKLKDDCTPPAPVKVKACNTITGKIEDVVKGKENTPPHTTDLSKCAPKPEKVEACNTDTGEIEFVDKGKENTPPHTTDLSKCEEVPEPEMVEACNTETGQIEEVEEGKENTPPYTTDLSQCEKIPACNTETGVIEQVLPGKANTPPHTTDLSKCEKVKACNTDTGVIEWVLPGKANTPPYTTDLSKCEKQPEKVPVCNTETGAFEEVEAGKENTPPYTTDFSKCKKVQVCNTETGEKEWVLPGKADTPPYTTDMTECEETPEPEMVEACNTDTMEIDEVEKGKENVAPHTTDMSKCEEVPETPETPDELPKTGVAGILQAIVGVGSLTAAGSYYLASRKQ